MPRIPAFVIAVALGNLLVLVNSTMIVVALPLIARDLAVNRTASAWLVTSYLIAMASLQPIAGRLGDRVGRRRLMLGALVYFVLASMGAALSNDIVVLVIFRLQQALAAAAIVPNGLAILRGSSAEGRAGAYFGISGATTGVGAAAGPLLGGLLASIDWAALPPTKAGSNDPGSPRNAIMELAQCKEDSHGEPRRPPRAAPGRDVPAPGSATEGSMLTVPSKISPSDARRVLDESPFAKWWGFILEDLGEGEAGLALPFRAEMLRAGGYIQGGASMALADAAFWLALMTVVGEEQMALTLEMKTNFLRGARGDLHCRAHVLKAGRRIVYGEASTTERDLLVAHHTLTYMRAAG